MMVLNVGICRQRTRLQYQIQKIFIIIIDDMVIFNNSIGDITAVDIETGMITWQLPTQSSSIINETYNFKIQN